MQQAALKWAPIAVEIPGLRGSRPIAKIIASILIIFIFALILSFNIK